MEITDIRVRTVGDEGKLKAYATVTFDGVFVVHNIKVIRSDDNLFIAMPTRLTSNHEYKDVAHPITTEFRNLLQKKVIAAYLDALERPAP
ncbi:MAG: SpoVG family protein [Spirochaetia bacterium]|jgi:stage V sporulation protein G|nr:SpoVG family protein [Spirochaetia bacterium]